MPTLLHRLDQDVIITGVIVSMLCYLEAGVEGRWNMCTPNTYAYHYCTTGLLRQPVGLSLGMNALQPQPKAPCGLSVMSQWYSKSRSCSPVLPAAQTPFAATVGLNKHVVHVYTQLRQAVCLSLGMT